MNSTAVAAAQESSESMALLRRAVERFRTRSTDQAPAPMQLEVSAYTDPERFAREVDAIFMRLPLGLALSLELPGPGSYRTLNVMSTPVLLVRDRDGVVRAFLNACRHRGALVCEQARGKAERLVCPYHAWQYDLQGRLTGLYGESTFGDIDKSRNGLVALPCAERLGIVWVALRPGNDFEIDEWIGPFAEPLASLRLEDWELFEQRDIAGPNWKVVWDGYLEAYHHNTVHPQTVGRYTIGNLLLHDTYGPHQRIVFARRSLAEIVDQPEDSWDPAPHIRQIHSVFPNLSISGVVGDHCLVSQVFPGPRVDQTTTRQTVLVAREPGTDEERAASQAFSDLVLRAVRDEDYRIGAGIQSALAAGANREFTFGRNEPALQHYHRTVARFAAGS
ncbi:MAG: aromatic ring-hydroxylating dioxygenase subunit alpha [Burkholderiales bacterium]|nr:MAG: aromatic ring-hydroxylating dioxygenase subunit alpha [Burkholderiales bacterium]